MKRIANWFVDRLARKLNWRLLEAYNEQWDIIFALREQDPHRLGMLHNYLQISRRRLSWTEPELRKEIVELKEKLNKYEK